MGYMKEIDRRIRQGGDDAIAAACELSGLVKERRGYEDTMNATGEITDIVIVLRAVGFAAVSPEAGDSASLLHYCVTHAADEIERLRLDAAHAEIERLRQFDRSQPIKPADATPDTHATPIKGSVQNRCTLTVEEREAIYRAEARLRTAYVPDDETAATLRNLLERLA
jgi:hypothetical protein